MFNTMKDNQVTQQLLEAVIKKDLITVKALCNSNNVNSTVGKKGLTALHFAALYYDNLDIAKHLMNTPGCDVNKPCFAGEPPIFLAALKGHEDLVKLFLRKGAAIDAALLNKYSKYLEINHPQILEILKHPETVLQQSSYTWQPSPASSGSSLRQRTQSTNATTVEMVSLQSERLYH